MRVAVVTDRTAHDVKTARTQRLDRLARYLSETDDHEVTVCCSQWWEGDVPTFEQAGIEYRRVTKDGSSRRFATRLPRVLRRTGADIVVASYWPVSAAVSAATARWFARMPVVVDWFGSRPVDPDRRLTRAAVRLPNMIVTPSRHVQTGVRGLGVEGTQTKIVPESIDIDRIQSIPPTERAAIVTARPLDEAANVDMMLLGLAELRNRDWQAVVIGDGPAKASYEQQAAELRIDDRVTFPGELPLDERIATYRGAHVFVQTAEHCPFARELLWALASGCVGIVDYQEDSAAHELVERRDRGFRTTSPEELSAAIASAADLEERDYDDQFAEYDHARVLAQYVSLIEEQIQ